MPIIILQDCVLFWISVFLLFWRYILPTRFFYQYPKECLIAICILLKFFSTFIIFTNIPLNFTHWYLHLEIAFELILTFIKYSKSLFIFSKSPYFIPLGSYFISFLKELNKPTLVHLSWLDYNNNELR